MISEDAIDPRLAPRLLKKKRILVASLLTLAAVGTHWLPGRTIVATQNQPERSVAIAASDRPITGPNSLLGDVAPDNTAKALAVSADLTQYHLDADDVVDQAGSSRLLSDVAPVASDVVITSEIGSVGSISQASAVPEPRTAGLLLLAAAPVLIRRKGRDTTAI